MGRNNLLKKSLDTTSKKLQDASDLIKEKDGVIQILHDELATHQLELVQKESKLAETEKKLRDLEAENKNLVERWMAQKQKEATEMNEVNDYMSSALNKMKFWTTRRQTTMSSIDAQSVISEYAFS